MRQVPFTREQIEAITHDYPTPFHIYDEAAIRGHARRFQKAFAWMPGFKNYFAVKALPNPHVMAILHEEGMGFDCSSGAELELASRLGVRGEEIMFTSNDTPAYEYAKAVDLGPLSTSTT